MKQGLGRIVIGNPQQLCQLLPGAQDFGFAAIGAQMIEQPHAFGSPAVAQQVILAPPDQRRNQQTGKVEVIERLRGKAQRGHQIAHGKRRGKAQAVHPRHRHPFGMQPRDDQPGQLLALAHQHHDIARRGAAGRPLSLAFDQREAMVHPRPDLLGNAVGQLPVAAR